MKYDFDMTIIGGGSAGLTASGMSASLGARTAMIEANKLGGDCTWTGCVPSKTLLKAAKVAHSFKTANRYGLESGEAKFDFSKVMDHVHRVQQEIYDDADAPEIYEKMGVKVIFGQAQFENPHTIRISDGHTSPKRLTSRFFIVAVGSSAVVPSIEGLSQVPYLTNETIFSLKELPERLVVLGAGPIGIELAQAFNRFGSEVIVVDLADGILVRDDRDLAGIMMDRLQQEGVTFMLNSTARRFEGKSGAIRISIEENASKKSNNLECDALLLAVGRRANTDGLNLERAGVNTNHAGIITNRRCRTSRRNIFACGDVVGSYQFTHFAEHMAKVATTNALLHLPMSLDSKHITWCTYTEPELAHVGASETELRRNGSRFEVYRFPFSKIDRAITDNEKLGWIKVYARKLNGKILGVSILGANAGEMIGEYALAMRNGVTLRHIADTIHPYPTYVLGNRRAADQWYVRKQSRAFVWLVQRLFRYHGRLPDTSDPDRIV